LYPRIFVSKVISSSSQYSFMKQLSVQDLEMVCSCLGYSHCNGYMMFSAVKNWPKYNLHILSSLAKDCIINHGFQISRVVCFCPPFLSALFVSVFLACYVVQKYSLLPYFCVSWDSCSWITT